MNLYQLIVSVVGYDNYYKGRFYDRRTIYYESSSLIDKQYQHKFKVKSQRTSKMYNVIIKNNGFSLNDVSCTCEQYVKTHKCKHIAAVLYNYDEEIFSQEYIDVEGASLNILNTFLSTNQIKEKVNIEVELNIDYTISFKLLVGTKHMYTLNSETKVREFLDAINNNTTYEFGKNFTYNPNLHYIDQKGIELIKYAYNAKKNNNYYYGYNRDLFELSIRELDALFSILRGNSFKIKDYGLVEDIKDGLPTQFQIVLDDNNYKLKIDDFSSYYFIGDSYKYVLYNHILYILKNEEVTYLTQLKENKLDFLIIGKQYLNEFSNGLLKKIKDNIVIDENITDISIPTKPEAKLYFDILYSKLSCNVVFDYNNKEVSYFEKSDILRDCEEEQTVILELMTLGFYEKNNSLVMEDDDLIYNFLENYLSELGNKYQIFTSKKIDNTKILKNIKTNSNFSIGQDGIMSYQFDIDGIDQNELSNVFEALKAKKKYYKLKSNEVISLEENDNLVELNNLMIDLDLTNGEINSGNIEIPKYRALYIDSLKQTKYKNIKTNNLFDEFIYNFKKYQNINIDFDKFDDKTLRPYQKDGVKWLTTIYKCDLGGILADEMGLGKSIQTISFIKQILKEKKDAKILIVSPTSLIYNWQREFEKFGCDLKYVVVAESKIKRKEILKQKSEYNIFITTYGLIRNDGDEYENMDFELCVIDEAQTIKNYQAGMTKEIKKIKSKCKIALTGTPVENNVTELWSIFDFIMPGYLNSILKFKDKYNIKDVDEESIKILKMLNIQITPFILRRKKIDVAKSLPDKIENKIYIEMPSKQKMLYLKLLNDTKKEMDEVIKNEGFSKARMKILQLLMKLRQVCIDPTVMYDNYDGERAKIEELIRIIQEYKENGHKILIFSSFKRVLDNVKKELTKNSISSYMIDGSVKSKDRMQMVESFNKDNTDCFLITLKAGGTGLNLIGADTVIHLDIWWNPQVENQATDRTHRIGQTKKVTVVKLIMKGTIEERILELQEKKKILSENLIEGNQGSDVLSSLTEKDIRKLLSDME